MHTHSNLDTFHRLLPLAAKGNVRLVVVNRRDYAGSTKYTDDNLKDLNDGNVSFMGRLGAEVAHLLIWFAETHKVPKISADRKSGGFAVMGWSMGNATPMAVLGHPEFVGKEAYAKLEPYFRRLILYGMSSR
jgi:pimeloyl-ACP methyl ester carboxylesterase